MGKRGLPSPLPLFQICDQFEDSLNEIVSQPGYKEEVRGNPALQMFVDDTIARVKKLKLVWMVTWDHETEERERMERDRKGRLRIVK